MSKVICIRPTTFFGKVRHYFGTDSMLICARRNQNQFEKTFTSILVGMIGWGPNQVGAASFHLQYAFRQADDELHTGRQVSTRYHT